MKLISYCMALSLDELLLRQKNQKADQTSYVYKGKPEYPIVAGLTLVTSSLRLTKVLCYPNTVLSYPPTTLFNLPSFIIFCSFII